MNRRGFLAALAAGLAAPAVEGRKVYSFLWDNPLVVSGVDLGIPGTDKTVLICGMQVTWDAFGGLFQDPRQNWDSEPVYLRRVEAARSQLEKRLLGGDLLTMLMQLRPVPPSLTEVERSLAETRLQRWHGRKRG